MSDIPKTDAEWKEKLTDEQYHVLREKGTEVPFSGKYLKHNEKGMYTCAACGAELFSSDKKLDSSKSDPGLQGWPSFSDPGVAENVGTRPDDSLGMHRTEIYCKKCGSHLGHVFDERVSGANRKHYCVNSVCLNFEEKL